jgi:hypothetical protein
VRPVVDGRMTVTHLGDARAGMVATVKSSGCTSESSSRATGADTGAPGLGRTPYADAIVRSRAFWSQSTKTRSPHSSFHHFVVTSPGGRRSSSRPMAMAAWRTS